MKHTHILFVILLVTMVILLIGRASLNISKIVKRGGVEDDHAQRIIRNEPFTGMTNQYNAFGSGTTEQMENAGTSNSSSLKSVMPIRSNSGSTLSDDEAHRIALNAIKGASGISNICSFSVQQEERNGRTFKVVTFLGKPLSDSKIEYYLYKVGVNLPNGQVLFIRRPAD